MRRDLQGNNLSEIVLGPCSGKGYGYLKVCGEFCTFRAQVWWGDNSARRGGGSPSSAGSSISGTSQKLALRSSPGAMANASIELVGNLIENEKAALRRLACCVWDRIQDVCVSVCCSIIAFNSERRRAR